MCEKEKCVLTLGGLDDFWSEWIYEWKNVRPSIYILVLNAGMDCLTWKSSATSKQLNDFGQESPFRLVLLEFFYRKKHIFKFWKQVELVWQGSCIGTFTIISQPLRIEEATLALSRNIQGYSGLKIHRIFSYELKISSNSFILTWLFQLKFRAILYFQN